jgi:RHS repeat-associated protein
LPIDRGSALDSGALFIETPFGQSVDAYTDTGAPAIPYRFQGRILQSAEGSTDLYDFGARSYDPSLGTFTSFDTVSGSAQNPLTLNRYLYALGNPASFIDPSGHCSYNANTHKNEGSDCGILPDGKDASQYSDVNKGAVSQKTEHNAVHVGVATVYHTTTVKTCITDTMCFTTQRVTSETVTFWVPEGNSDFATAKQIDEMQARDKETGGHEYQDYVEANGLYAIYAIQQAGKDDPRWKYGKGVFQTADAYVQFHWGADDQTAGASLGPLTITETTGLGKDNYYAGTWAEDEPQKIRSVGNQLDFLWNMGQVGVSGGGAVATCPSILACPASLFGLAGSVRGLIEYLDRGPDMDNPNWIPPCEAYDARCPARWNTSLP